MLRASRSVDRIPVLGLRPALSILTGLVTVLTSASTAFANGRFPESNQLLFAEHDPDFVTVRATFGLLISHDRGKTFEWVCEQAIGYSGVEDPMYAVTPSNAIIGATFEGVSTTRDRGCSWAFAGGDLKGQAFIDLAANPTDKKNVVVFASAYDKQDDAGRTLFASKIWETKDEGLTYQQVGAPLDAAYLGFTIDLTRTDPNRMYLSVVRNPGSQAEAILLTSTNRGQTWAEEPLPLVGDERSFYIASVDPTNAERVYLRTYANSIDSPTRLVLREADPDGGAPRMRTIYEAAGALPGFALTADGAKVYVGGSKDGIRIASTTDFVFTQRSTLAVNCLGLDADGLWACSSERLGFSAGLSKDDGLTFEPRLRWCDLKGPISSCAATSPTSNRCAGANWAVQKSALGCSGDIGASSDGGLSDAGPELAPSKTLEDGCSCHVAPAGPWGLFASSAAGLLALVRRLRRKSWW